MNTDRFRFRFWLEEEHRWFYFGFETFATYQKQIESALADGLKIYQSTGIRDKNDRQIFEGDIVSYYQPDYELDEGDREQGLVIWGDKYDYPAFDIEGHDLDCNMFSFLLANDYEIEVIGHIKEEK